MKISPSVILVSVAVLVAGYTVYDYRQAAQREGVGEHEVRPFVSDPRETTKIQMLRAGGEKILLTREVASDKWKMSEPVTDEVEGSAVDAILFSLTSQKAKELTPEGGGAPKWSEFGLEPPAMEFEVVSGKKIEKLAISSKNSFDGSFYLRFQDKMYLGDRGLAHLLAKSANSLRTKKLWRHDSDAAENSIHKIEVQFDSFESGRPSTYSLLKDNGLWSLRPQPKFPVDPELIEKWLESVLRLSAQDIEVENPTAEDLKRTLMTKPSFQVSFEWSEGQEKAQGKADKWQLTVGQDLAENKGQEAFLSQSERSTLYKVAVDRLKDVRVGPEHFRDRKRAFQFNLEQATDVEFYLKGKKYVAIKNGSEWKLDGQKEGGTEKLDTAKLESLFQKLSGLRVASFVNGKDLPESREDQKLVLRSTSGEVLLNLRWGGYLKGKDGKPDRSKRFVRTQNESENLLVENQGVETLVDSGLVVVK